MKHILEVDSVILEFRNKRVLQDIYLKIETGEVSGLLGLNGSGKTCLMNIIYGQLRPTNSSVRMNRTLLVSGFRFPDKIRYLPQFGFIPKALSLKRIFNDFKMDFSEFINEFPEFKKYHQTKIGKLSTGEQRIVETFIILTAKTKFCLLDEPFSQIMPKHVEKIKEIIGREKLNKGILITDHMYNQVIDICDNLYILASGKTHLSKDTHDIERLGYIRKTV